MNKQMKEVSKAIKADKLDLARRVKLCDCMVAAAIRSVLEASKFREVLRKEGVLVTPAEKKHRAATMKAAKLQRRRARYAEKKGGK